MLYHHRLYLMRENSIDYIIQMPPDFAIITLKGYLYIEPDFKLKLINMNGFIKYMNGKGKLLDEI